MWTGISDFVSFPHGYEYGNAMKIDMSILEGLKTL